MRISSVPTAVRSIKNLYPIEKLACFCVVLAMVAITSWGWWQRTEKQNKQDAEIGKGLEWSFLKIQPVKKGVLLVPKPDPEGTLNFYIASGVWLKQKTVTVGFDFSRGDNHGSQRFRIVAIQQDGIMVYYDSRGRSGHFSGTAKLNWK